MTRVLSELLGATEPQFRLGLMQLERASGMPSHDVRLSAEVLQGVQVKLRELGLDPYDTKGRELHAALKTRLINDEKHFADKLRANSPKSDDPIAHVVLGLKKVIEPNTCFALKGAAAKKLLKANLPKKTMKLLGYRSADSMLKHESVANLYAATALIENDQWHKRQMSSYSKLKATDFESRKIAIEHPTAKRWLKLAESVVAEKRHNILIFKELGTVVLLPLPEKRPELITLTTAVLTLHAVNEIRAAGTYLKLHQVRPNFGSLVKQAVLGEATVSLALLDQPVSWNMVQHYFARYRDQVRTDILEPVVQAEDFAWHYVEATLSRIEPSLGFWKGTHHFGLVADGKPVSFSLTDQLLSHCNKLPYEGRQLQYFKQALSTELSLRYIQFERLEEALTGQLHKQLAAEPVAA